MKDKLEQYNWQKLGGVPAGEYATVTTITLPSIYSDVCKQEQIMADTLQQWRIVLQHDENNNVVRYHICEPNPHSAHRVR